MWLLRSILLVFSNVQHAIIECVCAGNTVPQHLLPYEAELGATVTVESLIRHVCHMEKRPCIPQDWELLSQVSSHR